MEYKKGDIVFIQDGTAKRRATVVENGIDSQNRVRVKPDGFPLTLSISLDNTKDVYIIK